MRHLTQALSAMIIFLGLVAHAQTIYVWEDSEGRKHYTQLKPSEHMQSGVNKKNKRDTYIPEEADKKSYSEKQPTRAFLIDSDDIIEQMQNSKKKTEMMKQKEEMEREKAEREREEREKEEELSTIAKEEKRREANCKIAQDNLNTIAQYLEGEYSDLKYEDEDGNEVALEADEIQKMHSASQEEVDYFCN